MVDFSFESDWMRGWLEFPKPVIARDIVFSRPIGILDGEDSINTHGVIGVLIRASVQSLRNSNMV